MITFLTETKDRALIRHWGVWLMKRDPERGLKVHFHSSVPASWILIAPAMKLLMSRDMGKRRERPEEDLELLEQIRDVDPVAGVQFLEYLVLQKRSTVGLSSELCDTYIPSSIVTRPPYTSCYIVC